MSITQKEYQDKLEIGLNRVSDVQFKTDANTTLLERFNSGSFMKNFQHILDSQTGTISADVAPFVSQVWPLIEGWYPMFPLKDLISVQPLEQPLGYIMFSKLVTANTASPTKAGDIVETPNGSRVIKGTYPTGEIIGEVIEDIQSEDNTFKALLGFYPLSVGITNGDLNKIKIVINDHIYVPLTIIGNTLSLTLFGGTSASGVELDIATGLITIPASVEASVTRINASYVRVLEYATKENLPKVKEFITNIPIEAKPRALSHEWTVYAEYLKKTQFNRDIAKDNMERMFNLLYQYQTRYILDELYEYATGNGSVEYALTIPTGTVAVDNYVQKIKEQLSDVSAIVEKANGRVEGNRLVVGRKFKGILESLDSHNFQMDDSKDMGYNNPRYLGKFGKYLTFYDPSLPVDKAFMLYKGNEMYESPYILAEYMPVTPTKLVPDGINMTETFCSMEAYKYTNPDGVVKIKLV